jgi:hypothetical protein
LSDQGTEVGPLHPVGSTLLRVAALAGRFADAKLLSRVLERTAASPQRARSLYGTAPRALAYARAIVAGRASRFDVVASELALAARHPWVQLPVRDHAVLVRLGELARERGFDCPDESSDLTREAWISAEMRGWVEVVWPELAQ